MPVLLLIWAFVVKLFGGTLGLLAYAAPHIPTIVKIGDKLYDAWTEAREAKAEQARQRSLAAIDARRANELKQIDADMLAAEKERDRRAKELHDTWVANADAAVKLAADEAVKARSELADAPPSPKP